MTEEESNNVALLEKGYAFWHQSKADCEGASCWMDLLSEDVQWRSLAGGAAGIGAAPSGLRGNRLRLTSGKQH